MSIEPSGASPGLPVVNQAVEPAWVRNGTAGTQKAYSTALAFEQVLVQQLSKSLEATTGEGSEEGEGASSDAGSSELSSMLPQALSAGVMSAGGLGLAAQLTRELEGGLSGSAAAAVGAQTSPAGAGAAAGGASAPTSVDATGGSAT